MPKVRWHAVWQGFLAFGTLVTAGMLQLGVMSPKAVGLLILVMAGLQAATTAYYVAAPKITATQPPPP
jgi:hypothetical protein